jgi:ABC-2 type transport system permease protein
MTTLIHAWFLFVRLLRQLLRQPWWIAMTIIQPIIWLTLYGQLFQKVTMLPGFGATSYIDFLTPGVVTMSALFSSGWSGMGMLNDLDRGVMDRFLVSPASRPAIIGGRLMNLAATNVFQSLILIALGYLMGARYAGGLLGVVVLIVSAVMLALPIASLSMALALTLRRMESIIGATNFILLPMTFLSPVFMSEALMPQWIRTVSIVNPVRLSVQAGRAALMGQANWGEIGVRLGFLLLFMLASGWLATRAFRAYQRSI